jgi:putative ABC transport system permease protein
VVTALHRKLFRDVWHLRGQILAIALVTASGVGVVVASRVGYESLATSQATYYATYRFAEVFAHLKRAPESLAARIAAIPGVASVRTRLVQDVTLDIPGRAEPATGRLTAIPERQRPILNDVYVRKGRYVTPGRRQEVLISEAFAKANRLEVGDEIAAVMNGRRAKLQIVGIALSPEYVYAIHGSSLFPDNERFGVVWMSREAMGPALDMEGAFNDVLVDLVSERDENEVIARMDRLLEPFGGLGAYGRDDHLSHRLLSDELSQNQVMGTVMPTIFLGVAAFLLNVVLTRLVATQRDQIGVLKAFGYRPFTVAIHYLDLALIAVLLGAAVGTPVGLVLASKINQTYAELYNFPVLGFRVSPEMFVLAIGGCVLAAVAGAAAALRRIWALPAAEAMRPEAPPNYRAGRMERLVVHRWISPAMRIMLRNLARRPGRAVASVVGIAFAVAILIFGRFFVDAIRHVAEVQFRLVQRETITLVTNEPVSASAIHEIARLPGVMRAEPFRSVPARLRFENRVKRISVTALHDGSELRRLIDESLNQVRLPPEGLLLTTKLAEILGVSAGDTLDLEVLVGNRDVRRVAVSGTVDELIGLSAYMDAKALERLLREGGSHSGAFITTDALQDAELSALLKELPAIGGILRREAAYESFEKTLGESIGLFTSVLVGFACVIAFAVVYNTAKIALSERSRELASLRVLGFTRGEISGILLGEQALLVVFAIPVGCLIGYGVCALLSSAYQWELFRLPLILRGGTFAFATLFVLLASLGSSLIVRRLLNRLDLVAVLKHRE